MAIWEKFNPRERMTAIGAGLVILGWIVSIAGYGIGAGTISLLGAIAVLAIYYLKYAPNQNINWPVPVPLLVLGIAGIVALLTAIDVLTSLRYLGLLGFGIGVIALVLEAIGAALMAWGAWQEYQIEKPAMPNFSAGSTTTPPAAPPPAAPPPPAYPTSAPSAPAAPPTTPDDNEGAPPA
ncbi:MAG TPA: hypothetical protein VFY18_15340 [Candidatus Limnocylindrales bacterium]|nr:hypothetical protein [Candidatus Limnocylindrales bacterium]